MKRFYFKQKRITLNDFSKRFIIKPIVFYFGLLFFVQVKFTKCTQSKIEDNTIMYFDTNLISLLKSNTSLMLKNQP